MADNCRQHFQLTLFYQSDCILYLDLDITAICSHMSSYQYNNIGSNDGLAPNRPQAIIWTIYVSLGPNELL